MVRRWRSTASGASGATSCARSSSPGRKDIEVVAINDLGPVETNAHLLRFDSVHGRFPHEVAVDGDTISVGGGKIKVTAIKNPGRTAAQGARRRHRAGMHGHLHRARQGRRPSDRRRQARASSRRPSDGADLTVVYGVNHDKLTKDASRRLQRLVHDQLPRPGRQGAQRRDRHRPRLHDDDPFLHRRPADARHAAQGSLPRPRRGACR